MRNVTRASTSFLISLLLHSLFALLVGTYMVYTESKTIQKWIETRFLEPKEPPKPEARKLVKKPVVKPTVPTETQVVQRVEVTPRVTTDTVVRTTTFKPQTVLEFSNKMAKVEAPVNPNVPRVINPNKSVPQVTTDADIPVSDAPGALAFSAPVLSGGGGINKAIQKKPRGRSVRLEKEVQHLPPGIQSLIGATDAKSTALDSVIKGIRLGNKLLPPMAPNELGARIATDPKTGETTGYFQICYVRFRQAGMNTLFRVDPTALYFLVKWMSTNTRIKGRISGRTLYIDDPKILESPMLYMNGTRPAHLSASEKQNLTRYLVEKGGFIFVDDDRNHGPLSGKLFANSLRIQFREIILGAGGRELRSIPKDHPIWNQPFKLGGQPYSPLTEPIYPMTAFELEGRLSVVISYNDYNNGWEAPGRGIGVDNVASILRMGVNFMFYAATHGKINDYKHYVPPDRWQKEDILLPTRAPQTANIQATPRSKRK